MEAFVNRMLNLFEQGKISRRSLIEGLAVTAMTCYGVRKVSGSELVAAAAPVDHPHLDAFLVNHISYSCDDYRKARDFYADLMGMTVNNDRPDAQDPKFGQCDLVFGQSTEVPYTGTDLTAQQKALAASMPLTFIIPRNFRPRPAPAAAQNGQRGRGGAAAPPQSQVLIDHIAYTIADWDQARVKEELTQRGLNPREDTVNSYHVTDPHGYDLQISGVGMTAFN
jgi:catechol 2,3-dioxygenase-like lactoylglutathione lyase family enzyme